MSAIDDATKALGTTPISDAAPAGESARYDPEFERIEAEVAKLESVNPTDINWKAVVADATAILSTKSKDLLVAAFLCRGLLDTEGYPGLAAGLAVMQGLAENFWDPLFPPRPRARAAAATWVAEKGAPAVTARPPAPNEGEAVAEAMAALEALDTVLTEKLADQAPALGELRRALREHAKSAERAAQPSAPAAPRPQAATGAAPSAPPTAITSDSDVQKAVKACQESMRAMAAYQRGKSPANPAPYLTLRFAAWLGLTQAPPDNEGVTQIQEPAPDRLAALTAMVEGGAHAELVEQAEGSVSRLPFWLDPHRYAALGLEALGHADAAQAVKDATALFLRRFPGARRLCFVGGTPFADDATQLWIDSEVLPGGAGAGDGGGGAEAAPQADLEPWKAVLKQAKSKAAKKKVAEGLALFDVGVREAVTGRDRFQWELTRARYCLDAGHGPVAAHLLEALDDTVERHGLETWEPDLAVEVAKMLLLCYKGLPKAKEMAPERKERVERLQSRLCRLDVRAALEMPDK
jgi:type VI secretion system protein VasJ